MNPKPTLLALALLLGLALTLPAPVLADVAPPQQPPGSNLDPGGTTKVQMKAETVDLFIDSLAENAIQQGSRFAQHHSYALVRASFWMQNAGSAEERLRVRFPLASPQGYGYGNLPEISYFKVSVNQVDTPFVREEQLYPGSKALVPWAVFNVAFPAGQEVRIDLQYTTSPTGYYPEAGFHYILETGAGWDGPIGKADLKLHLPYELNKKNVYYTRPEGQISGRQITWQFEALEPATKDNLDVELVDPYHWKKILAARQAVSQKPQEGNGWLDLARLTLAAARGIKGYAAMYAGTPELLDESLKAHERVLALWPNDVESHESYGGLLGVLMYQSNDPNSPWVAKLEAEIAAIRKLNPQSAALPELENTLSFFKSLKRTTLIPPTAPPTITRTSTATAIPPTATTQPPTVASTLTSRATSTSQPLSPTPTPAASSPLTCALPAFGLVAAVSAVGWRRRAR